VTFHHATGNLLDSHCTGLVNPVNCVGVAGAGLARQFRDRWPVQVAEYTKFCRDGKMRPGVIHEALLPTGQTILSVPTKRHFRDQSRLDDVRLGVRALAEWLRRSPVTIAIPPLGCGLGGLPKAEVLALIEEELGEAEVDIWLYDFNAM
jgi:O-acetyl-ADP-ribose deacetylase (regulator of RNase III)